MPRCPNCNFPLVLLLHRMKYKCAKCSKLYPQREIEINDFREWDKQQRVLDKENLKPKKIIKIKVEKPKKIKLTNEERQERRLESYKRYYDKIKEKKNQRARILRQENKKKYRLSRKNYRRNKLDQARFEDRLNYWRKKQKALALEMLENEPYEACTKDIWFSPPTF